MSGEAKDFNELAAAALDGSLDGENAVRLLEMCRRDPELRDRFAGQVDVDRLLEMALADISGVSFGAEVIERIRKEDGKVFVRPVMGRLEKISSRAKWRRRMAVAGIAAAVVLAAGWWMAGLRVDARVHRDDAARWSGERPPERLKAGRRVRLEGGLAEIHFRNGAELILEGPADLEIRGPGAGWLHKGKAAVHVPERGIGFTLDSPGGRVIDLGTSFGVEVGAGGETETQVFEGKVKIVLAGEKTDLILNENETFAVTRNRREKSTGIAESTFVTGLPPRAVEGMKFVHWPMDEGRGAKVRAAGRGRTDGVSAELRGFKVGNGVPGWIDGAFGTALSFEGHGQAVETFHAGPGGDAARTIAFWVRVPVDFDPDQGYGIISWGELTEPGTAWQISANPASKEGGLGRLRMGIGKASVVGVTDLRDGKWHHCAVVLYRDAKKPERFPVLLYVDGKMESAARKAVHHVRTGEGEGSRPIWIGRSLGHGVPDRNPAGTGFFRGDLDEVYVFEGALNRRQVEDLMRHNRPPGK